MKKIYQAEWGEWFNLEHISRINIERSVNTTVAAEISILGVEHVIRKKTGVENLDESKVVIKQVNRLLDAWLEYHSQA